MTIHRNSARSERTPRSDERIWYAAYGSNLSRVRFDHYLRGGTPEGAGRTYPGCRDHSDPVDVKASEIDRELLFGGTSRTWGGGVAFVDPERSTQTSRARLYLITLEQFSDVVAQENWLDPGSVSIEDRGSPELNVGDDLSYGLVLGLGELDGSPVLTVTRPRGTLPARPSAAYLRHVHLGLVEAYGLTVSEVVSYLMSKRGVVGEFTEDELVSLLGG